MKKFLFAVLILCAVLFSGRANACTDILVKAADGSVVVGRSMELGIDTHSRIWFIPKAGDVKYSFLGIDSFGEKSYICDGMNEAGLAAEALFFTGAEYEKAGSEDSIPMTDLVTRLLSQCASVQEARESLSKVKVIGVYIPKFHQVQGFHIAVHDASGKSLVVEFIGGEMKMYDNPVGVMTNHPTFDWQLTNLRNYINLDNFDHAPKMLGEAKIESTGSGSGWVGLPGDWTPPSRFVRTALFVNKAPQPKNALDALILANHIMFTVDIPHGLVKTRVTPAEIFTDLTQWVVLKDLTNKVLYYRTYNNPSLRKIDFKKLNAESKGKSLSIPIESPDLIEDLSGKLE